MNATVRLEFNAAVLDLVERCKSSGDPPSRELTDELIDALNPTGLREAARVGLIEGANNALHVERTQRNDKRPASGGGYTVDGRNPRAQRDSLKVTLMGADGKLKELMEFTADDCELLRLNAVSQKVAWTHRETWAARARQFLEQSHRAAKVGDLRKECVAELRQLAEEAWS